jgi:Mlc titration factor MtfA (ptsG expression regulator)
MGCVMDGLLLAPASRLPTRALFFAMQKEFIALVDESVDDLCRLNMTLDLSLLARCRRVQRCLQLLPVLSWEGT